MAEPSVAHARLGKELRRLLALAGISGREMGRRLEVSQPQVARYLRGESLPPLPVVRRMLDEVDASDADRTVVMQLAESALTQTKSWQSLFEDEVQLQTRIGERDRAAVLIRNYNPTVLPGLLQTSAYARAALSMGRGTDIAGAVAARMERQVILHERDRRFEFVITERLLRWPPGEGAMAGQAARLQSLMSEPAIEVAVLPDMVNPGVLPWHNFVLRTGPDGVVRVSAELVHGSVDDSADADTVAACERAWKLLWDASLRGDEAAQLIRKA